MPDDARHSDSTYVHTYIRSSLVIHCCTTEALASHSEPGLHGCYLVSPAASRRSRLLSQGQASYQLIAETKVSGDLNPNHLIDSARYLVLEGICLSFVLLLLMLGLQLMCIIKRPTNFNFNTDFNIITS